MKTKFLFIALLMGATAFAQNNSEKQNSPLKFNLNKDGTHWVKATFLSQIWLRETQTNPGSTVFYEPVDNVFDIGLRRTRLQLMGQITDKVFFYTQFGLNNFHYTSARYAGAFFHDAIIEYEVAKRAVTIGGGLTGWSGLTRYASPSIGKIMSLDAPLYQQATNGASDQFVRKLSVYAKGKIGKLDYRMALTKPMTIQTAVAPIAPLSTRSDYSLKPPKTQYQGYFMYQFKDEESNKTPYTPGTYLGTKSVFNIGTGIIYQPDAMWHLNGTDTVSSVLMLFGFDVFYDAPINAEKGNAITVYAAYTYYDYGPNYTRNVGVMNPANGVNTNGTFSGAGNSFTMVGTGSTIYAQVGYLFGKDFLPKGRLQPYFASQLGLYERLADNMLMFETGVNWYLNGRHNEKLSFNYQNRPVHDFEPNGDVVQVERKGMFTLQFQIAI